MAIIAPIEINMKQKFLSSHCRQITCTIILLLLPMVACAPNKIFPRRNISLFSVILKNPPKPITVRELDALDWKKEEKLHPLKQAQRMELLIAILLDKNALKIPVEVPNLLYRKDEINRRRAKSAILLGQEIAHSDAIPALISVINDKGEDTHVRYAAITGLSMIPDKSVILVLLDMLNDDKIDLRFRAYEQLDKLGVGLEDQSERPEMRYPVGKQFGYSIYAPPEERLLAIRKWKSWWETNHKSFIFRRSRVMTEY